MKQLSKLTPAETLLVLEDKNASIKELLKLTFMDLLLKQVLSVYEVQRQTGSADPVRHYKYIETGKNYKLYQANPHENVFLAPFQKSESAQILFRHMVKMAYQNAKSDSKLQNVIKQSPDITGCFSRSLMQSVFGGFSISREGQELRNQIKSEIEELEKELPPLLLNGHPKALDVLKAIKGNIFLLSNIQFDLLKQVDMELLAEMNKRDANSNDSACYAWTWDSFDHYSDSFDSSCSGDSGCSGCGGCGGD